MTFVLLAVPWLWLISDVHDKLDYLHRRVGGTLSPDKNFGRAGLVALLTPLVAWAAVGGGRRSARLLAYVAALSAASWLLAIAYVSWYYDRHI